MDESEKLEKKKAQERVNELRKKMVDLEAEAKKKGIETESQWKEAKKELEGRLKEAEKVLAEAGRKSDEAYQHVRSGIKDAIDDLERAFRKAKGSL